MSGNICAATNSPSSCSKATTISSVNPAPHGSSSPTIPNASPQSHPELGRRSILEAVGISGFKKSVQPSRHRTGISRRVGNRTEQARARDGSKAGTLAERARIAALDLLEIEALTHQPQDDAGQVLLRHEVLHARRQKLYLVDFPGGEIACSSRRTE